MKRMLLHICCAPCSTYVIEVLKPIYKIAGFFYNPNIHPESQYKLRLEEIIRYAEIAGIDLVVGEYEVRRWFDLVRGLEDEPEGGRRCRICYRMRLERTAQYAAEHGFDIITTTLSISPHKKADVINRIGAEVAGKHGVGFLQADFKKKGGFQK
ncbi:TPA: epoxyqueuosine reductase QueH, partial [Candidatus Poribacteria bacterium]|nr:epoxyqueuosine reductase QueH [Candidatus Poribacteria bacterium]